MTEREQVGADDRTLEKLGLLLETKQYTTAVTVAGAFLVAHPGDPDALVALGEAHRGLGNADAAFDAFSRALGAEPDHYMAAVCLAGTLSDVGDHSRALRVVRELVRVHPDEGGSHFAFAVIALAAKDKKLLNEAYAAAAKAVELMPEDSDVHMVLGYAAHRLRDRETARRATEEALRLDPNNARALNNRGLMMKRFRSGRRAAEIDTYARAAALDPLDTVARFNLEVVVYNTLARTGWYLALPMAAAIVFSLLAAISALESPGSAVPRVVGGVLVVVAMWGYWAWFNVRRIPVDRRAVLKAVARKSGPVRAIGTSLAVFAVATVAVIPVSIAVPLLSAALFPLLIAHRIVSLTSRAMLRRRHPNRR